MVKEEIFYKAILDNLTGGLISIDTEGIVVYINHMAGQILRLKEKDCLNKNYKISFSNFPELLTIIERIIKTGKTARRQEMKILHADMPLKIGYSTMLVKDSDRVLGYSIIFQDISFAS